MHSFRAAAILLALGSACGSGPAIAQPASESEAGVRDNGVWLGVSLDAETAEVPGSQGGYPEQVRFGGFYLLGLRIGKVITTNRNLALEYVLDLVPAAVATEIPSGGDYYEDRGAVYGLGLSPIGFQLVLAPGRQAKLYAGGTAGFLIFTRDVPVQDSRQFHFRFEGGIGLQFTIAPTWAVTLGIGRQHLSSGTRNRTEVPNPGLDHWVLRIGVSRPNRIVGH